MNNKGFGQVFILAGVVVVLVLAGGYYLKTQGLILNSALAPTSSKSATPPITDTTSWQTYTNTEYKYTIQYPSEVVHETKVVKDSPAQTVNTTHDYFKIKGGILEIYGLCGREFKPIKQYSISVAGNNIMKGYETDNSGVYPAIRRPNSSESVCFNFQLPQDSNKDIVDKMFDQILSTLKLTDQGLTVDTSNWQTYTNDRHGFSLKYPQSWHSYTDSTYHYDSKIDFFIYLSPDSPRTSGIGLPKGIKVFVNDPHGDPKNYSNKDHLDVLSFAKKEASDPTSVHLDSINRIQLIRSSGLSGAGNSGPAVYIEKGDVIIEVIAESIDLAIFDQILSTFKFTN